MERGQHIDERPGTIMLPASNLEKTTSSPNVTASIIILEGRRWLQA
jgi:hypothetical protein